MIVGLFQKNPNRRNWGHTFFKKKPVTLPLEILDKKSFLYNWKFCKIVLHPLEIQNQFKIQDQKIRLMKIQKSFTDGNSVKLFNTLWSPTEIALLFLLNSRISGWYFLQYPRKFHVLNPPPPHLDLIYIYIFSYIIFCGILFFKTNCNID